MESNEDKIANFPSVPSGQTGTRSENEKGIASSVAEMLEKLGLNEQQLKAVRDSIEGMNVEESLEKARTYVNDSLNKAREYAKQNPGVVIGGLSALVIAAGLLTASTLKRRSE